MVEYHEAAEAASSEHCSAAASAGPLTGLAQRFGVNDMYITDTSDLQTQTIEQEFQSYISGKPTKEKTDIVKFWEVSMM
jgi:phage portal protein BeeE